MKNQLPENIRKLRKSVGMRQEEATSALDAQTARQVSDAILRLDGLTRIVVTHTLDEAVLILILNKKLQFEKLEFFIRDII